ncbi:hypothetical protein [Streptococcus infantis]|uniref:hypothetical protein n=1 Tax=Streptococcus infantis TaxID=68892 RepID=UPI0039C26231
MKNDSLDLIIREVENQQERELERFELNLSEGITKYKEILPNDLITPQLQEKIDNEVKLQLVEFQKSIDLKPKALYHALKVDAELNPDIEKKELKQSAYEFLEKTTKNKYLKKIIRELKKGV